MPKYRKRPIIIEAEQFGGFYATPYPAGVQMEDNSNNPELERYRFYTVTAHGHKAYIEAGDWVIAEPDGQTGYYPCKDIVFREFYDLFLPDDTPC